LNTKPFNKTFFAVLAASIFTIPAWADEATAALDPIIVTATRTPTLVSTVNAAVTVVSREQLALLQGSDVAEALMQVAGIDVIRTGGPGQPVSVFVRGSESNHTLVLVDGVRLNDSNSGIAALQDIPLESIERIEIVKGPRSNQWGSDAIGGVIHIITRTATQQGFSGDVMARYGRYNSTDLSGTLGYRAAQGGISATLERQETDGYPPFRGATVDATYENMTGTLAADWKLGVGKLTAKTIYADGMGERLGFAAATAVEAYDFVRRSSALGWTGAITDQWQTTLSLQWMGDDSEDQQPLFGTMPDFYKTDRKGLDWQNVVTLGAHQLTLGAHFADEDTKASVSDSLVNESTITKAVFAQDAVRYGRHSVLASGRYTDHDSFGGYTTGAIDYGFAITPDVTAGIGYGTAFRAPTASEQFLSFPAGFFPAFFANPDLDPEKSRNLEASLKARINEAQTVAFSVYQNRIKDLINAEYDPVTGEGTSVNVDRAKITGIEADYQLLQGPWNFGVNGNLQKAKDEATNQRLLRRASKSLSAQMGRRFGPHRLGLQLQAVGDRPDIDFASFPSQPVSLGGYGLLTLLGEAQLLPRLTLGARVENLLDHDYQTVSGYRQSGIAGYGTLRYRF